MAGGYDGSKHTAIHVATNDLHIDPHGLCLACSLSDLSRCFETPPTILEEKTRLLFPLTNPYR